MTDETTTQEPDVAAATEEGTPEAPAKLKQEVEIKDLGKCKKHIKVVVSRDDITEKFNEEYKGLVGDAYIPGFRPGKAPRQIVVRKFKKDVSDRIRGQILLASLEQLAEDHDIAPLAPPNIDPSKLDLKDTEDFTYEFDVEVRPEFTLPEYKGLKLKRPVRTITEQDVEKEQRRILSRYGQLVPKNDQPAENGDYVIVDMATRFGGSVIGTSKEITLRVEDSLAFKDGIAKDFGKKVIGAKAGDTRIVEIDMTESVALEGLRGKTVEATIEIKDVKFLRLPELTHEFLHTFDCHSVEQFNEQVRVLLERRHEYQQRQSAREQIIQQLVGDTKWDLPEDLLVRQARRAFGRRVMEMRDMGMSDEDIQARQRVLERDVIQTTALSLQEHFVLQKIAELEKIDVDDDDINDEIEFLADQQGESPRKVRAQLEREDLLDTLAAQMIERRALDMLMESAQFEDVAAETEAGFAAVEQQAVPGEMKDPTAAPAEEPASETANG